MPITYACSWDPRTLEPVAVMTEETARMYDDAGKKYIVFLGDIDEPTAVLEVARGNGRIAVYLMDAHRRIETVSEFHDLDDQHIFLTTLSWCGYPDDQWHDPKDSNLFYRWNFRPDGTGSLELRDDRAGRSGAGDFTFPSEFCREPVPGFGQWSALVRPDRIGGLEATRSALSGDFDPAAVIEEYRSRLDPTTPVLYGRRWLPYESKALELIGAGAARADDAVGTPFTVVLGDIDSPEATLHIDRGAGRFHVFFLDEHRRLAQRYDFGPGDDHRIFLTTVTWWSYPDNRWYDPKGANIMHRATFRAEGSGRSESWGPAADQYVSAEFTFDAAICWEPTPVFGSWRSLARRDRSAAIEPNQP